MPQQAPNRFSPDQSGPPNNTLRLAAHLNARSMKTEPNHSNNNCILQKYLKFGRSVYLYALIDLGEQKKSVIRSRVFRGARSLSSMGGKDNKTLCIV